MSSEFDSLTVEDFVYDSETLNPPESMLRYRPGGLHPVMLGDVICSKSARYHVVQKLGWGGYATVWLAQDFDSLDWFALRIRESRHMHDGEDEVLQHIASGNRSPHLPIVRDIFSITGPNGTHTVTVTGVVSPLDHTLRRLTAKAHSVNLKAIVRELVEGVAHMHASGIIHGDLHIRNVGLAMPSLRNDDHGGRDPYGLACPSIPDVIVILGRSETIQTLTARGHFPRYLVSPTDLEVSYEQLCCKNLSHRHVVQIFDFGNCTSRCRFYFICP